jgi:hypothetical protein
MEMIGRRKKSRREGKSNSGLARISSASFRISFPVFFSSVFIAFFLVAFLFVPFLAPLAFADPDPPSQPAATPVLSTDQIVQRLMAANARRAERLRSYQGKRIYKLDYKGWFGGQAEMVVEATYRAPNQKDFRIISESGSRVLLRQVLAKLLDTEREAQEENLRKALEITPANYYFTFENIEHTPTGDFYVLAVKPRSRSKYVYDGKIWVDARDFAVARMDGSPATNPSMWVKHVEIQYQWQRVDGGFWLPVHNYSATDVRFGGKAVLNISYSDYQVTSTGQGTTSNAADKNPTLPDPATLSVDPH